MYAHAEKVTGRVVVPSKDQSDKGEALWRGNRANPQFGRAGQAMKSEDDDRPAMELDHYSPLRGLKELKPSMQGTGAFGIHAQESQRHNRIPRTYYYHAGTEPEGTFKAGHYQKYRAKLPKNWKLYDIGKDPEGYLRPKWRQTDEGRFYEPANLDEVEQKIRKKYHGYHNYHPTIPNAVALFYPLPVKPVAKNESDYSVNTDSLVKSDVEVLMQHPARAERQMALKLPGVTATDLRRAVGDPDAQVALAALRHPLATPEVLTQALAHAAPNVRIAAARHPLCDGGHLEQALADTNPLVRRALATSPNLEAHHIQALIDGGDPEVLEAVATNPRLTPEQAVAILINPAVSAGTKLLVANSNHVPAEMRKSVLPQLEAEFRRGAAQWLALRKGGIAAKRWPSEGKHGVDDQTWEHLDDWQHNVQKPAREELAQAGVMDENDRQRALHRLHGATKVRLNPQGQREFLLHRGLGGRELNRGLDHERKNFASDTASSWTPNMTIAASQLRPGGVLSAWVPEHHIRYVPNQARGDFKDEHEVIIPAGAVVSVDAHHPRRVAENTSHWDRTLPGNVDARVNALADLAGQRQWAGANAPGFNTRTPAQDAKTVLQYRNKPTFGKAEAEDESLSAEAAHQPGNQVRGEASDVMPLADPDFVADFEGQHLGDDDVFEAARFLAGAHGPKLAPEALRGFVWEEDGDREAAALRAYGMEPDEEHRTSLRAVLAVVAAQQAEHAPKHRDPFAIHNEDERLGKAEMVTPGGDGNAFEPQARPHTPGSIEALTPSAEPVAQAVQDAYAEEKVEAVQLKGKHSNGTLVAHDPHSDDVWLLKPGSGPPSPAAGIADTHGSQSAREACFYACAKQVFGLGDSCPECELLAVDGKEVAAMKFLPPQFRAIEKRAKDDSMHVLWSLHAYLKTGLLHKWAVMDWVLGNVDRHGQNILANNGQPERMYLIDHGSAFAGLDFDPAHDRSSFVPYYLRAWAPRKFNTLPPEEKLKRMPVADFHVEVLLRDWLAGLHGGALQATISRYGLDPEACLARLAHVKALLSDPQVRDISKAINSLWVG
jgi:hypothetical protein